MSAQILAATFTIAFEGLMLFQGPTASEKTHVAIVDALHHDPYVQVIGQNKIPLKKGDRITFSTGPGVGHTDSWFDRYVVTLKDHVVFGNVDREVVAKNINHAGTLATVDLPKGNLTILFTFPYSVKLDTWFTSSTTRCFPRYVLLTTQTSKVATMTIVRKTGPPEQYAIDNGIVVVSNGGPQGATDSHFHEYRRMLGKFALLETATLLRDPCYVGSPQPIPAGLDDNVVKALLDRINAIPNGDCGPVDNP